MGGEVSVSNSDIVFTKILIAYTLNTQDFCPCVDITHASYIGWSRGWSLNNGIRGVNGWYCRDYQTNRGSSIVLQHE
jgi:hypothetical protein